MAPLKYARLRELLLQLFNKKELKQFISDNFSHKIIQTVDWDQPEQSIADDVTQALARRRLVNAELHNALLRERPECKNDIDKVFDTPIQGHTSQQPAPKPIRVTPNSEAQHSETQPATVCHPSPKAGPASTRVPMRRVVSALYELPYSQRIRLLRSFDLIGNSDEEASDKDLISRAVVHAQHDGRIQKLVKALNLVTSTAHDRN